MDAAALLKEERLTYRQLADDLGRDQGTVRRWAQNGVLRNGRRVKLEAVRVGGLWLTSRQAFERFVRACSATEDPPAVESPHQKKVRDARAFRELRAAGVKC